MTDRRLSLNGPWRIRADHGNVGLAEGWHREPHEFLEGRACRTINVPAAWQHVLGEEYHYLAWYRKSLTIPDDWNWPRTRLRFDSVATVIDVWIGGDHVGRHVGDWLPIEFDVTHHVRPGKTIEIVARVDEGPGHITKGFHDMLSIHHGGIWADMALLGSGAVVARPDGVWVRPDARTGVVEITAELAEVTATSGALAATITTPDGATVEESVSFENDRSPRVTLRIDEVERWSPESPTLYDARIDLIDADDVADRHDRRFGFRTIEVDGTRVLFNGTPFHLRGVLHWGHEPSHLAPAPPPEQVRDEFARLRELGFNAVCLCMWYPPRHYYDIADETGMILWQEHPNWHAPMFDEHVAEYRRLYAGFMRRDRNHPSIVIVSGTCEHPSFHPEVGDWWWRTAHEMLPDKLLQVQTSSFAWSDPAQTDLYDEHTYDNNNRWVTYLQDLQDTLADMDPKPFIMGESVLFTSWPDIAAIRASEGQSARWSLPRMHQSMEFFEHEIRERFGDATLERFRRQADRHHILGRKFQIELFRRYPNHAGLVTNHLRDVPACACGFMDALGRWRFDPSQTRGWMCDAPLLLRMPDERRSFASEERFEGALLVANFGPHDIDDQAALTFDGEARINARLRAPKGGVGEARFSTVLPAAKTPRRVAVVASMSRSPDNTWDLWVFPPRARSPERAYRIEGLPFDPEDAEPDPLEGGYSRGFGLPVKRWVNRLPDPAALAPDLPAWRHDAPIPDDARVIATHKLTQPIVDFLQSGGRALLFASKTAGGLATEYEWLFGQCSLVVEHGPLREGDSEWIVDLLSFDLTRTYARVIPTEKLGLRDVVSPLIRLAFTHDQDRVIALDMLFTMRVGDAGGVLAVSSLDHHDPAGQLLLGRMIEHLATAAAGGGPCVHASDLRPHCV